MVETDLLLCVSINDEASLYIYIFCLSIKYASVVCVTNKRFTNLNM